MWVSRTYANIAVGTAVMNAIAPTTAVFNQYEHSARSKVLAILAHAGYESPGTALTDGTDSAAFLRSVCVAQLCREAAGNRKGITFPVAVTDAFELLNAVYEKRLPVPGMTPSTSAGYGGVKISAGTGSAARPQVFARGKLTGY